VNTAQKQSGSIKCGKFLDWQTKLEYLKRNSVVRIYLVTKEVPRQEHMLKSGGIIHSLVSN
jgi:hypothetical protein